MPELNLPQDLAGELERHIAELDKPGLSTFIASQGPAVSWFLRNRHAILTALRTPQQDAAGDVSYSERLEYEWRIIDVEMAAVRDIREAIKPFRALIDRIEGIFGWSCSLNDRGERLKDDPIYVAAYLAAHNERYPNEAVSTEDDRTPPPERLGDDVVERVAQGFSERASYVIHNAFDWDGVSDADWETLTVTLHDLAAHELRAAISALARSQGEREKIVAWLREQQSNMQRDDATPAALVLLGLIHAIERGEHLGETNNG